MPPETEEERAARLARERQLEPGTPMVDLNPPEDEPDEEDLNVTTSDQTPQQQPSPKPTPSARETKAFLITAKDEATLAEKVKKFKNEFEEAIKDLPPEIKKHCKLTETIQGNTRIITITLPPKEMEQFIAAAKTKGLITENELPATPAVDAARKEHGLTPTATTPTPGNGAKSTTPEPTPIVPAPRH